MCTSGVALVDRLSVAGQVVDSTADSNRRAQSALDSAASSVGRSAGILGASRGQPAPFANMPLTSLPSFTADKEDVRASGLHAWIVNPSCAPRDLTAHNIMALSLHMHLGLTTCYLGHHHIEQQQGC
jgi:hypothetical protein